MFGPATTTRHVYDVAARHVVEGAMHGINGENMHFILSSLLFNFQNGLIGWPILCWNLHCDVPFEQAQYLHMESLAVVKLIQCM